jgi:hypothetical protein
VHAPTEDRCDNVKDSFYEELQHAFDQFPELLEYFVIFSSIHTPRLERTSQTEIRMKVYMKLVMIMGFYTANFVLSKNVSVVQCSIFTSSMNTLGLLLTGRHNQTDYVLVDKLCSSLI